MAATVDSVGVRVFFEGSIRGSEGEMYGNVSFKTDRRSGVTLHGINPKSVDKRQLQFVVKQATGQTKVTDLTLSMEEVETLRIFQKVMHKGRIVDEDRTPQGIRFAPGRIYEFILYTKVASEGHIPVLIQDEAIVQEEPRKEDWAAIILDLRRQAAAIEATELVLTTKSEMNDLKTDLSFLEEVVSGEPGEPIVERTARESRIFEIKARLDQIQAGPGVAMIQKAAALREQANALEEKRDMHRAQEIRMHVQDAVQIVRERGVEGILSDNFGESFVQRNDVQIAVSRAKEAFHAAQRGDNAVAQQTAFSAATAALEVFKNAEELTDVRQGLSNFFSNFLNNNNLRQ